MTPLTLTHQRLHGVALITATGELDSTNRTYFEAYLAEVGSQLPYVMVLDLSQLTFMDSSGLGAIIIATQAQRARGGDLWLAAVRPTPRYLITRTGLEPYLKVHATVDDALTAARSHPADS
ncbi:STAS domain-containing protein [Nonomuraea sp. NPDC005692]|uniref:STAS domain-containing protein n=1 Tax=Nonomuraea sp. NPDC005692 TaxID=3157168 RepID=UPI0033F06F38